MRKSFWQNILSASLLVSILLFGFIIGRSHDEKELDPDPTDTAKRQSTSDSKHSKHKERDFAARKALRGSRPKSPSILEKRNKVKEMMLFAWNNYEKFAWGENALLPVSKNSSGGVFGNAKLGATIIDSLSTLYLMGLDKEFSKAHRWVAEELHFDYDETVSVFETNIRIVGGLLSAYAMTGYKTFKKKAEEMANKLLPAFETPKGIPMPYVHLKNGESLDEEFDGTSLAETGTLHLEFVYLSNITKNPVYAKKVRKIRNHLDNLPKLKGLYPTRIDYESGKFNTSNLSIGAEGDSFYEYLLKSWIQTGRKDRQARRMYDDAVRNVREVLFQRSHPSHLLYVAEMISESLDPHMSHLACFSGGMFALGARGSKHPRRWRKIAREIGRTCWESYHRAVTGIGPEVFTFGDGYEAVSDSDRFYILRPEVVESLFYLWRLQKDEIYRKWAWQFVQSLEKYCRTPHGFSGISTVYSTDPPLDDLQQTFFLAETLKYLYLIFSEDDALPLDQWVFNTEAHPLPILTGYPKELISKE